MFRIFAPLVLAFSLIASVVSAQAVVTQQTSSISSAIFNTWAAFARHDVEQTKCLPATEEEPCAVKDHWLKQLSSQELAKYAAAGRISQDRLAAHVDRYLKDRR